MRMTRGVLRDDACRDADAQSAGGGWRRLSMPHRLADSNSLLVASELSAQAAIILLIHSTAHWLAVTPETRHRSVSLGLVLASENVAESLCHASVGAVSRHSSIVTFTIHGSYIFAAPR